MKRYSLRNNRLCHKYADGSAIASSAMSIFPVEYIGYGGNKGIAGTDVMSGGKGEVLTSIFTGLPGEYGKVKYLAENTYMNNLDEAESSRNYSNQLASTYNNTYDFSNIGNQFSNTSYAKNNYDPNHFLASDKKAIGKMVGNIFAEAGKGAQFGSSIGGGLGAIIGTLVGTFRGVGENVAARNKAMDAAVALTNDLNKRATFANNMFYNNMQDAVKNTQMNNYNNVLLNYMSRGGYLYPNGGVLGSSSNINNGVDVIEEGGTHEENPNEGVPVSIAPDGMPNLVEEGEVIYDDFVFSNRILLPDEYKKEFKLSGKKDYTFAEVAIKLQEESEERPNDSISKRGLDDMMGRLAEIQEEIKAEEDAYEKHLSDIEKTNEFNQLPVDAQSAIIDAGINGMAGQAEQQMQNGAVVPQQPMSNEEMMQQQLAAQQANQAGVGLQGLPYRYGGGLNKYIRGKHLLAKGKEGELKPLDMSQDRSYLEVEPLDASQYLKDVKLIPKVKTDTTFNSSKWMRFAPIIGAFSSMMRNNKRDLSPLYDVRNYIKNVPKVSYRPIGYKMTYTPIDTSYLANQLYNKNLAGLKTLQNLSNGATPTLLSRAMLMNYMGQKAYSDALISAAKENADRLASVNTFNASVNEKNNHYSQNAQTQNANSYLTPLNVLNNLANEEIANRVYEQALKEKAIQNFYDNIGKYGLDSLNANLVNTNALAKIYGSGNENLLKNIKKRGGALKKNRLNKYI